MDRFSSFNSQALKLNPDTIQSFCAIIVMILTAVMTLYAYKALKTYKSQILFEIEIEAKALALRSFELYLKLNLDEFHEHLLKGEFLKQYEARHEFYGTDFINNHNEALIRRLIVEQTDADIEEEMKQIRILTYKVLSTFQNKPKQKYLYRYYSKFFTHYQLYKYHCRNLTAFIFEHHNEQLSKKKEGLLGEIEKLTYYFSVEQCRKRNDELQLLMEKATGIE